MIQSIHSDFLIIGSGVAGLRAAIELSRHGRVMVVTKDMPTESSTEYAQGGVAVALSDEDEVGIHFEDTLKAGDGLCNEEAVAVLVEEGPRRILELIEWGAEFDNEGTKLAFTREGAHSRSRVLHARGDSTGKEMERALISKVKSLQGIRGSRFSTAVDLMVRNGVCNGAAILRGSDILNVNAKATVACHRRRRSGLFEDDQSGRCQLVTASALRSEQVQCSKTWSLSSSIPLRSMYRRPRNFSSARR